MTDVISNTVKPRPYLHARMEAGIKRMMDAQEQPYNFAAFEANHVKETRLPADIAHAVAFFVSPLADYITGANLRVGGGMMPTVN